MARDFLLDLALAQRAFRQHVAMRADQNIPLSKEQEALCAEAYVAPRVAREDDAIPDLELDGHEVPVVQDAPSPHGYDGPFFGYLLRSIGYENAAFGFVFYVIRYDDDAITKRL
jgi:hypothetical protein